MNARTGNVFPPPARARRRPQRRRHLRDTLPATPGAGTESAASPVEPVLPVPGAAASAPSPWTAAVIARLAGDPGLRLELRRGALLFQFGD